MTTGRRGDRARELLTGTRFADVRWVDETGSTNADVLALARDGEPEGVVCVADHQTAGRGRQGRTWSAPPAASLLLTVLLRPPARVSAATTMTAAVALAEAVHDVGGFDARLKWPNDLIWPGDGSLPDRKLAGILAEADWPPGRRTSGGWAEPGADERVVVAVGVGLNVNWPAELPGELADRAVAANHVAGRDLDREQLLIAFLRRLDHHYDVLAGSGDPSVIRSEWLLRSATLGRRVRVELGADDAEGEAVDVTVDGHLVVETDEGTRRVFAVGDVVHLRPLG